MHLEPKTQYRLRLSSATHRLLTKKMSAKRVAPLLESARADFAAFTDKEFGIAAEGYSLSICDADGFSLYYTCDGTHWQRPVSPIGIATMFR